MTKAHRGTMVYEELHSRYGSHVARRVQQELTAVEFAHIALQKLPTWLETRAEAAHKDYQMRLDNPFACEEMNGHGTHLIDTLYHRWQQAEELAYIIAVAEDVSTQSHVSAGGK